MSGRTACTAVVVGVAAATVVAIPVPAEARVASPVAPTRATQSEPSPDPVVPDVEALGWQAVLDEDFDAGGLDDRLWQAHEGPGLRGGSYTRDAVRIEPHPDEPGNDVLTLTAYTEGGEHYGGTVSTGTSEQPIWSGFRGAYGFIEARIRLNDGPASTAAFWTMPFSSHERPYGDPAAGGPEMDIMESVYQPGGDVGPCWPHLEPDGQPVPCNEQHRAMLHWDDLDGDRRGGDGRWYVNPASTPLQGNFHTYSVLWTPEGYRFYLDGIEVHRSEQAISYGLQHLILGQYIRSSDVPPSHDYGSLQTSATKLMVDHVKVWQRPISDVPDQSVGRDGSLAVPFTVTDHAYADPVVGQDDPRSVDVAAVSTDQSVIADDDIVVTGNGPAEPGGSLSNGSFELEDDGPDDGQGWEFPDQESNTARVWTDRAWAGESSLRLEKEGGRAEQTITGLEPDTTYMVGARYNLELEWDDLDSDGRVDAGESFLPGGANARFEWGIDDVASSLPDDTERLTKQRNGWHEHDQWWSVHEDHWIHDNIFFSTGPDTTEVTLYVSNEAEVGTNWAADLSFDGVYLEPVVPADRTVAFRAQPGATGTTTILLISVDADGATAVEDFDVTVGASSLTNGGFEAQPTGSGWDFRHGGAEVVVEDPFTLDRAVELGRDGIGTLQQSITGLETDTEYTLEASGQVVDGSGSMAVGVQGHGNPQELISFAGETWDTKTTTFRTGLSTDTASLVILDWSSGEDDNDYSLADDIRIYPTGSPGAGSPPAEPELGDLDELALPASSPAAVAVDVPGGTVTGIDSDDPQLLPARNLAVAGTGGEHLLSLTPVPGRSGRATVRVFTDPGQTQWQEIDVVVSEPWLRNPGFESPWPDGWALQGGASVVGAAAPRSGDQALELPGGASAQQALTATLVSTGPGQQARAGLSCNAPYVIGGWASGDVELTVTGTGGTPATVGWSGAGWSEALATFRSPGCYDQGSQPFEITVASTGSGGGDALVDDLYLFRVPDVSPIRDLSVHEDQTSFGWPNQRDFHVGHVSDHALWDDGQVTVTSSDDQVVPLGNVQLTKPGWEWGDSALMHTWRMRAIAGDTTGRSDVTVAVTDPATGVTTEQTFTVTVNAGTSFDNGDLQRGLRGWDRVDGASADLRHRRRQRLPNPPSTDHDQVLRVSEGVVMHRVAGLAPDTEYVVQASARGDGSDLVVHGLCTDPACDGDDDLSEAPVLGQDTIDSPGAWAPAGLSFQTGPAETEVWLAVVDQTPDPVGSEPCVQYTPGETCIDDIGLFRSADVS